MDFNPLFSTKNRIDNLSYKDLLQTSDYIEIVKAFSRITYQSIYIIDYQSKAFEFVSDNPLFLAGLTPEQVLSMGYGFYQKFVPAEDLQMLIDINNSGFEFYEKIPLEERKQYVISYDFHIQNANGKFILINHKLTPVFLTEEGKIWKSMCVVSLSTNTSSGNVTIGKLNSDLLWEMNLVTNKWSERKKTNLTERETEILRFYNQGLSINEIAEKIFISVDTVKFHRRKLFDKLEVNNINEALAYVIHHKLL
ncbi:LuxR family transcriptional regulator [Elizabethkingia anophelis]|uniref:response regulator transcription factor n=1 Tax=Elizabethkingia anophelis TaxID=1117645 RepID=UPI0004E31C00|nr:LuxR C-terminal-related transcriptional regulator [Elizabethkingia anophelis]KFC37401.1 LuxR family transcriptional regulator [Elizabethkingia anophelis]MDV3498873.1 DNA-binding response regulator [Elizabethkingia anophelis]